MKLTLRDLFWLMLVIASMTIWLVEIRRAIIFQRHPWHLIEALRGPSDQERKREEAVRAISQLTDEELIEKFESLPTNKFYQVAEGHYDRSNDYEPCLVEMGRRRLAGPLKQRYDTVMAQGAGKSGFDFPENLELLTALRRAQGHADPLIIHLEFDGPQRLASQFRKPTLKATIENVDVAQDPVRLREGGDYRGGRLERWRFVLTDELGHHVADSNSFWGGGGGLSQVGPLHYREQSSWGYRFDLRAYLSPPPSGRYQLQALYHDDISIAHESGLSGLVVVKSKPIPVVIDNRQGPNVRQRWVRFPAPLGMLAACLALTFTAIRARDNRSAAFDFSRYPGIPRRDFYWGLLVVSITLAMWLSDHSRINFDKAWYQRPDSDANWSIRMDEDAKQSN